MTVELRPLNVSCNLACTYCYQEAMREFTKNKGKYNIDLMLSEAEKTGKMFSLFGGEPLLVPKKDLEKFFSRGFELYKKNSIQTNGTLIDDDHINMFKKYNVQVGVSIDGPNDLNNLRLVRGNEEKTIEATKKTMNNLIKLSQSKVNTSVIVTLHRINGNKEDIYRLMNFLRWLGDLGITRGDIHLLEVDKTMKDVENVLSQEETKEAFLTLANFFNDNEDLSYNPFEDIKKIIVDSDMNSTSCIWNHCDSMNTQAVYGIEGDGSLSNCGRTNKEGIDWYKTDGNFYERYIGLYHTPTKYDGCGGCRFFMACGGGCPGEGSDGDLRNKTIHCETKYSLFEHYEKIAETKNITPFSKRNDLKELELIMINSLRSGKNMNMNEAIKIKESCKNDI